MASAEKRWLTTPSSKLSKAELPSILRKDTAWNSLSGETRQRLYDLLPSPVAGEEPHDINVHPLKSRYKTYIEEELRCWQEDLREGKETKKWREEAMKAGSDLKQGKWDEWKAKEHEMTWGKQAGRTSAQEDQEVAMVGQDV